MTQPTVDSVRKATANLARVVTDARKSATDGAAKAAGGGSGGPTAPISGS